MYETILLSTRTVATLFKVAETTVKRWADDKTLPCIKSPGGHRKFRLQDLQEFASKHHYPTTGLLPPPLSQIQKDQLLVGVTSKNFNLLKDIFLKEAIQADRSGLRDLLSYVYKHKILYGDIVDKIIKPAMEEVGRLWEQKMLEVNQEHLITQTVSEALLWFSTELIRKQKNGFKVVLCCGEDEYHCLGIQTIAYAFECEGWEIHHLGPNMPYDSLQSYIKKTKPTIVCLSITLKTNYDRYLRSIEQLSNDIHRGNGFLLVGGITLTNTKHYDIGIDYNPLTLKDTIDFSRNKIESLNNHIKG